MSLRPGTAEDAPACAAIVRAWLAPTPWMPDGPSREELEAIMREGFPRREVWVWGEPAEAYLSLDREEARVAGLYVGPRGRGIGRALVGRVKRGRDWLQLRSHMPNERAHRFLPPRGVRGLGIGPAGGRRRARAPDGMAGVSATIRIASPDDAPACASILQDWLDATPWMPDLHTIGETEGFVRRGLMASGEVLVADPGRVEGFVARHGEAIPALYVDAAARGRGVGSALIEAAQARATRLRLWTFRRNEGARRLYRRHGFREGRTTEGENEEGLPDVEMSWERGA